MTTVREIIQRSYRRLMLQASGEPMSATEASDGLAALNDMIYAWPLDSVETLHQGFVLTDTAVFFVPPRDLSSAAMTAVGYGGTWNASTNTPTLASATGTQGAVYRVSVAGSASLDGVSTWAADDFLVFDGAAWLKGLNSNRHLGGIAALLAVRMAADFGMTPPDVVVHDAQTGWAALLSDFIKIPDATFDAGLTRLPSRCWPYSTEAT